VLYTKINLSSKELVITNGVILTDTSKADGADPWLV
jgi:hypothetical protein